MRTCAAARSSTRAGWIGPSASAWSEPSSSICVRASVDVHPSIWQCTGCPPPRKTKATPTGSAACIPTTGNAPRDICGSLSDASGATEYAQTYRIITPAGAVRWIAARGEIVRDELGHTIMLLGAHVDITPMRTAELALAESDARLRLAQEAVGIGTWEWSRRTRRLLMSRQMLELWGFNPAEGEPDAGAAVARLHPADRWPVFRELARAYRLGQFQSEFRLLRPNAEGELQTIWVTARARLLSPNAGRGAGWWALPTR